MSSELIVNEPRPGQHGTSKISVWHGISELHRAALGTPEDVRKLLLNGADVTVRNHYGETALHYACQSGNWGGVFQLLLFGANLYDVDKGGRMCIHHAARSGCLLTFQYLEFLGINIMQRDKRGRTALHFAVEHGHCELIKYLIKQKKIDLKVKDNKLRTPMHEAVLQNNRQVCWILESSSSETLSDDKDQDGKTPLDYAMYSQNGLQLVRSLRRWQKMRKVNGRVAVPWASWITALITPSTSTLCMALVIWYFDSYLLIAVFNTAIFSFAFLFAMRPHRLWHVSQDANPGLCGWFYGSVILSLLIYFMLVLPKIWPDYMFTMFAFVMIATFVMSFRKVYKDPGISTETRVDKDGHPMGIIDVVSARIPSREYCARCKTAYPERTKHCRLCDCCYQGLDHHCLFLMTCVAINNHGSFLAMIASVFIAQVSFVRGTVIYFWSFISNNEEMSYLSILGTEPLISVYLVINCIGLWWTLSLILFQLKVISEGGTTCFLPNGELRTRIDCIHATGTIRELTVRQRIRYLKRFMKFYYLPPYTKSKTGQEKQQLV